MFDEKLKRARQLIEKRDQIDEELRALFCEVPHAKRGRRRIEKDIASGHIGNGADAVADAQE